MSVSYMNLHRAAVVANDGYDTISTLDIRKLVVQIVGDDSATWKLQGTLDGSRWYDIENESGAPSSAVNLAPQAFTVDKYDKVRLWYSNTALSYTVSIKGITN